ncbi:MAG: hypothetical protein JNG90_08435 [Planctomycetaceae bacterium]|nr:hypothetical protein [Planctomycetaceae bacterium]
MAIAASKVRAVCTSSETALVRASRKPVLDELSAAELKRHAARAKKLSDKWQDLSRTHARAKEAKTGFGEADANTRLKAEIFGEALKNFEARLAKLGATGGAKAPAGKRKKERNAEHRATRAAVRKGMAVVEEELNAPARQKKAAKAVAKAASAPKPAAAAPAPAKSGKPKRKKPAEVPSSIPPTKLKVKGLSMTAADQRRALTAAKQSRFDRSGKTSRTLGHVVARGKRAQARRDSKN